MTHRDLFWRAAGGALVAAGYLATHAVAGGAGAAAIVGLLGFLVAAAGLLLMLGGKKVPLALRIERGAHRNLPAAIRDGRRARRPGR